MFQRISCATFHVSQSTVSRVFNDIIDCLYCKFVPATVFWPESAEVTSNLPPALLKEYPSCVSIIDCFEISVERAGRLDDRAATFSSYKSHNTAKYLISITPQGFVNFISDGWGGRTSDKVITERSSYLDNLKDGDEVLADQGFNIIPLLRQ